MTRKAIYMLQIVIMMAISVGAGYMSVRLDGTIWSLVFGAICILIWIPIFGTAIQADTE